MTKDENLFRTRFEKVRKRYVDSLPEKLEALESAFKTAHANAESSLSNVSAYGTN